MEADVAEGFALVYVAEGDLLVFDSALQGLAQGFFLVWALCFLVEDVEDAFARGAGGLHHLVESVKFGDGFVKEGEEEDKTHELADGHGLGDDLPAADPKHERGAKGVGKGHRGRIQGPSFHDAEGALFQSLGAGGKTAVFVFVTAEGFDLSDALQVVHQQGIHGGGGFPLFAIAAMGGERVSQDAADEKRKGDQGHHSQKRVLEQKNAKDTENAQDGNDALFCAVNEHSFDGVDVFNDAGHEVAGGASVEVADGKFLKASVHFDSHIVDNVLFKVVVDQDSEAVKRFPKEKGADQNKDYPRKFLRLSLTDDLVDNVGRQAWINEGEGKRDDGASNRSRRHPLVGEKVADDAAGDFPRRTRAGAKSGKPARRRISANAHRAESMKTKREFFNR